MGRQGQDVGLPATLLGKLADRGRFPPDPVAPGRRERGWLEPEAKPDGARHPGRIENQDPNALLSSIDRADPRPGGDQCRDLDGEGRLAGATGEAQNTHEAQPGQDVGDRERPFARLPVVVRRFSLRRTDFVGPDDPQSGRLLRHRPSLLASGPANVGHRGSLGTPGAARHVRRSVHRSTPH